MFIFSFFHKASFAQRLPGSSCDLPIVLCAFVSGLTLCTEGQQLIAMFLISHYDSALKPSFKKIVSFQEAPFSHEQRSALRLRARLAGLRCPLLDP